MGRFQFDALEEYLEEDYEIIRIHEVEGAAYKQKLYFRTSKD